MPSLNSVSLIGHLGKDVEVRYTQSGEKQEQTQWHSVVCFGKVAQIARDYLSKGKPVFVQGQIVYEEWEDKQDGTKRRSTKIKVSGPNSRLILLGGRGDSGKAPVASEDVADFAAGSDDDENVPF